MVLIFHPAGGVCCLGYVMTLFKWLPFTKRSDVSLHRCALYVWTSRMTFMWIYISRTLRILITVSLCYLLAVWVRVKSSQHIVVPGRSVPREASMQNPCPLLGIRRKHAPSQRSMRWCNWYVAQKVSRDAPRAQHIITKQNICACSNYTYRGCPGALAIYVYCGY